MFPSFIVMSNLFNQPVTKALIGQLLGVSLTSNNEAIEEKFPKDFHPALVHKGSPHASEVFELARSLHLHIRTPRSIQQKQHVDLVAGGTYPYIRKDILEMPAFKGKRTLNLPVLSTVAFPKTVVQRTQLYGYDLKLYKQVLYQALMKHQSGASVEATKVVRDLTHAISDNFFGNGSIEGQLNRLKEMWNVRYGLKKKSGGEYNTPKTLNQLGRTNESVAKVLEKTMPLTGLPEGMPGLRYTVQEYLQPHMATVPPYFGNFLPPFVPTAKAGFPYPEAKKKDVTLECIALADGFLKAVSTAMKRITPLERVLSDWWFLGAAYMFPKTERYSREKYTTNTRNIMASPFVTHLLANQITHPPFDADTHNAVNYDTPSLAKFSPFHGGLNTLLEKSTAPGHHMWIYADNVYISYQRENGNHDWYSLDLVKSEANVTPDKSTALGYYFLTRGWVDKLRLPCFNATWAAVATAFIPSFTVDATTIVANLQLKTPGQQSGCSWTFLHNHVLSSLIWERWEQVHQPDPESQDFDKNVMEYLGLNIKIERKIPDLEKKLLEVRTTMENSTTTDMIWPTVELDLLGWAATYSKELGRYIPLLDNERFYLSAAYPKKVPGEEENKYVGFAYEIIRYEALYLVGGFAKGVIGKALTTLSENNRKIIFSESMERMNYLQPLKEKINNTGGIGITEFADDPYLQQVSFSHMPTLEDIENLNLGTQPQPLREVVVSVDPLQAIDQGAKALSALVEYEPDVIPDTITKLIATSVMASDLKGLLKEYEKYALMVQKLRKSSMEVPAVNWEQLKEKMENLEKMDWADLVQTEDSLSKTKQLLRSKTTVLRRDLIQIREKLQHAEAINMKYQEYKASTADYYNVDWERKQGVTKKEAALTPQRSAHIEFDIPVIKPTTAKRVKKKKRLREQETYEQMQHREAMEELERHKAEQSEHDEQTEGQASSSGWNILRQYEEAGSGGPFAKSK
jgi:hypothetical protein